jgi:hypothetical protein
MKQFIPRISKKLFLGALIYLLSFLPLIGSWIMTLASFYLTFKLVGWKLGLLFASMTLIPPISPFVAFLLSWWIASASLTRFFFSFFFLIF